MKVFPAELKTSANPPWSFPEAAWGVVSTVWLVLCFLLLWAGCLGPRAWGAGEGGDVPRVEKERVSLSKGAIGV